MYILKSFEVCVLIFEVPLRILYLKFFDQLHCLQGKGRTVYFHGNMVKIFIKKIISSDLFIRCN